MDVYVYGFPGMRVANIKNFVRDEYNDYKATNDRATNVHEIITIGSVLDIPDGTIPKPQSLSMLPAEIMGIVSGLWSLVIVAASIRSRMISRSDKLG